MAKQWKQTSLIFDDNNDIPTNVHAAEMEIMLEKLRGERIKNKIAEVQLNRISGDVVPVELIQSLFRQYAVNISGNMLMQLKNLLRGLKVEFEIPDSRELEITRDIVNYINYANDTSVDKTINELTEIVNEYSKMSKV